MQWLVDGKRRTKGFATETAATIYAKGLVAEVRENGKDAFEFRENELSEWRYFRDQIGRDTSIAEVLECWRQHGAREKLTVGKAIDRLVAARTAEGVAKSTLSHYKSIHDRLKNALGDRDVSSITQQDISDWLASLRMEPWSIRTHFIRVRSLFTWLRVQRLIAHSPVDGLRAPRIVPEDVSVLTVAQGQSLFGAANQAVTREVLGRLAIEAFAGVRFSTVAQLTANDILFAERGIVIQAAKIKTRRRQFVDGLPDNLWKWLEWSDPKTWKMNASDYMHAKSGAFARATVANPGNVLRHSFCSYHVAANKDAAKTAVILCHSSPKMLWSHYKGRATEADGVAWFQILPPG